MVGLAKLFIHHYNLTRQEVDMCRYFALGLLIALPLAAEDETRTIRCPKTVSVQIVWQETITADGPDGTVRLKLLEGADKTSASAENDGPVTWISKDGIDCLFRPRKNFEARYGDGGKVTSPITGIHFRQQASSVVNPTMMP